MIGTIIVFLALLSILVLAHEWGHYITAKKIGAKVEEFGLGFPPRLFSWRAKDGMLWSVNLIPLGGFVRIKGESGAERDAPGSFGRKSIPARTIVLLAGVFMNLVLAAVFFTIGFSIGLPSVTEGDTGKAIVSDQAIRVTQVLPDSPGDIAGFEAGDTILRIDGIEYVGGQDARDALMTEEEDRVFILGVLRGEEELMIEVVPEYLEEIDRLGIGIAMVETGTVRYPLYLAPIKGTEITLFYTKEVTVAFYEIIRNLVMGEPAGVELAGPVGIAVLTGEIARLGFVYLLQFAAILSINLAVINILPFPALDGGRIAFVALEAVRGKPASPRLEALVHNLGFVLLMLLVIFITYKDILNLF